MTNIASTQCGWEKGTFNSTCCNFHVTSGNRQKVAVVSTSCRTALIGHSANDAHVLLCNIV